MLFFEISKEKVKDIVKHFAKCYMLGDDIINHILKNIDEYTNNVNIQVKNEIIETSIPSISNKDINEVLIFYIHLLMLTMFIF